MRPLIIVIALLSATLAVARPVPVSPTSITTLPDGYDGILRTAIEGDWMVATAIKHLGMDPGGSDAYSQAAFLFHRAGTGPWQLVGKLLEGGYSYEFSPTDFPVVMENKILALQFGYDLVVYERGTAGYTRSTVIHEPYEIRGKLLQVDGQRILAGTGDCANAAVFEKNAGGAWVITGRLTGSLGGCLDADLTTSFDFSADYAIVDARFQAGAMDSRVFKRVPGQIEWQQVATLPALSGVTPTALRGPVALLGGANEQGVRVFRRTDPSGTAWDRIGTVEPIDLAISGGGGPDFIRQRNDLVLINADVWQQQADNTFEHIARLDDARPASWSYFADFYNRTVVMPVSEGFATYELPAAFAPSPTPYREDFEGGSNAMWDAPAYGVAASGFTHVYRTQSLAPTLALLANSDWPNQSIEADLKPMWLAGSGWVGLVARRQDADNQFTVALSNGAISLRKRLRAVETLVATSVAPIVAGRTYRVRLETRGTRVLVRLNGVATLSATIRGLTHGSSALASNGAALDADNIVVSPIATTLLSAVAREDLYGFWTTEGGYWTESLEPNLVRHYKQNSVTGAARMHMGVARVDDQVIESDVRIARVGTGTDHWAGLLARYLDANNYYYLSLRSGNQLQIRKVVNGVSTALRNVPFTVTLNRVYKLRFEAIGNKLRAYVDGVLITEFADSALSAGQFGLATSRTATEFSAVDVYQP